MPRNGAGIYSKPANTTAVPNTTIESSKYNSVIDDLVTDANAARPVTAGGTAATSKQGAIDNILDGTTVIDDSDLRISDPSDRTKIARLDAGLITTETVRVLTAPDRDINIAGVSRGYIYGLILSNNASDPTNDIDIAAGEAADDSATPWCMVLASTLTKRLDAAWAVGSGNGGLDTGSIGDNTYHVWLIQRSDTGVVDALFSLSATAPTMPANYDRKRLIMSVIRSSGSLLGFTQIGSRVLLSAPFIIRTSTVGATNIQVACVVPVGRRVRPILSSQLGMNASSAGQNSIGDGDSATASFNYQQCNASSIDATVIDFVYTDTSRNVRFSTSASVGTYASNILNSLGWWDDRGANG